MKIYINLFIFVCYAVVCVFVVSGSSQIQDYLLCADPTCSEPISKAKTLLKYFSDDKTKLSFQKNEDVTIYGKLNKSPGEKERGFWLGEVNGKTGFVAPQLVKDYKVLKKHASLTYSVYTDDLLNKQGSVVDSRNDVIVNTPIGGVAAEVGDAGPPSSPHEVIDGTTFYLGTDGENVIEPSSTAEPSLMTKDVNSINSQSNVNPILHDSKSDNLANVLKAGEIEAADDDEDDDYDDENDEEEDDDGEGGDDSNDEDETKNVDLKNSNELLKDLDDLVAELSNDEIETDNDLKLEEDIGNTLNDSTLISESQPAEANQTDISDTPNVDPLPDQLQINPDVHTTEEEMHGTTPNIAHVIPPTPEISKPSGGSPSDNSARPILESAALPPSTEAPKETIPLDTVHQFTHEKIAEEALPSLPVPQETVPSSIFSGIYGAPKETIPSDTVLQLTPEKIAEDSLPSPPVPQEPVPSSLFSGIYPPQQLPLAHASEKESDSISSTSFPIPEEKKFDTVLPIGASDENLSPGNLVQEKVPSLSPLSILSPPSIPSIRGDELNVIPDLKISIESQVDDKAVPSLLAQDEEPSTNPFLNLGTVEDISPSSQNAIDKNATSLSPQDLGTVEDVSPSSQDAAEENTPSLLSQDSEVAGDSKGFFAGLFSGLFGGSIEPNEPVPDELPSVDVADSEEKTKDREIVLEGDCKSSAVLDTDCAGAPSHNEFFDFFEKETLNNNFPTILYLVITSITVLLFTLGYYFIEQRRLDGPLIAKVNQLTHDLQVATSQLETRGSQDYSLPEVDSKVVEALQAELEIIKKTKIDLETQLESQQQELEAAAEAGLELNKMLSDLLTQQHGSENLLQSVEQLQGQLDVQQKVIDDMNRSLMEKTAEGEVLRTELTSANEKIEGLEEELSDLKQNFDLVLKEKDDLLFELEGVNNKQEWNVSELKKKLSSEIADLTQSLQSVTQRLAIRDSEYEALSESVDKLRQGGNVDTEALYNVSNVKAELVRVVTERDTLQERLTDEEGARKLLEEHVKAVDMEVLNLRLSSEAAEKEKMEAETRLAVLSNYFKEKETQLQKELGLQEAMWVQKQGDESSVFDRIASLQEEVANYKAQNEIVKKEILDQERGLKGQIATLEKKAHENWVAARQAERKLVESKQEAGQLRNMLTLMEKTATDSEPKPAIQRLPGELNGDEPLPLPLLTDANSPLPFPPLPLDPLGPPPLLPPGFMPPFMPPPGGYLPPPPPFLPGDRRPAPLGRMSSPPLNHRFSPTPVDYEYDRMSPAPLSPPVRNYRSPRNLPNRQWDDGSRSFRPVTNSRDLRRDYQGTNLSSGHSSNESLDKPTRHGGNV